MAKYVKKPVVIEAIQWTGLNQEEIKEFCPTAKFQIIDTAWEVHKGPAHTLLIIPTLEGDHYASQGNYIIKGVHGEFYPCKEDIFHETYDSYDDVHLSYTITAEEVKTRGSSFTVKEIMESQPGTIQMTPEEERLLWVKISQTLHLPIDIVKKSAASILKAMSGVINNDMKENGSDE